MSISVHGLLLNLKLLISPFYSEMTDVPSGVTRCNYSFAGYLYDLTGSPTVTVASIGIVQALGGIWLCCIPAVQTYQIKKESQ